MKKRALQGANDSHDFHSPIAEQEHTMNRYRIAAIVLLCFGVWAMTSAQKARPRGPIIRQVDHILVASDNPKALFQFFTETLQLPQAWPLAENQGFISGGVGAGNVNLEIFRYTDPKAASLRGTPRARYTGLAFEPYPLSDALQELKVRGIPYGKPEPYISILPKGNKGTLWTTVGLPSFSHSGMSFFLYEYSPDYLNPAIHRKQLSNRITLNKGGPLGFRSVREIVLAASDFAAAAEAWGKLLGRERSPGYWRTVSGPAIRLVKDSKDYLKEIVFEVKSLNEARVFIEKNDFRGTVAPNSVTLYPAKIQGLTIRLVE